MTDTSTTPALSAPVAGETKREFLARNGLAVLTGKDGAPARGRFGKDAMEALAKFPDFAFADNKPAPKPKVVKVAKPTSEDTAQRAPSPLDMPRRRPENSGFSVVGNILVRQDICGSCKQPVAKCDEKSGPRAHAFLEKEAGEKVVLTLDKPLV